MPENLITTYAPSSLHELDLTVTLSGDSVTVSSGLFRANEVQYNLEEDETFQATLRSADTEIIGYVVLDSQGEPRVFVDEIQADGIDAPYDFGRSETMTLLFYLFQFIQPAGTTDLSQVTYNRWVVVES